MRWEREDRPIILIMMISLRITLVTPAGAGIIAYNCTHEETTSQEFSLLQQDPCPNFKAQRTYTEVLERVQLLQKKEFTSVHG